MGELVVKGKVGVLAKVSSAGEKRGGNCYVWLWCRNFGINLVIFELALVYLSMESHELK